MSFPNRNWQDLPDDHPIFSCVYQLEEPPQVPSIHHALGQRGSGVTWERYDAREVHYRAIFDDDGRMMVIICHNTDLGDGWEREGGKRVVFPRVLGKESLSHGNQHRVLRHDPLSWDSPRPRLNPLLCEGEGGNSRRPTRRRTA